MIPKHGKNRYGLGWWEIACSYSNFVPQEILKKVDALERAVKSQKSEIKTLKDLKLPHSCREVVDKDAQAVLNEIESSILQVAYTILKGEGFTYSLPNRSKANQLYVPGTCRSQVVMMRHHSSPRSN